MVAIVVDLPEPVGPVIRMIHLSARVALSIGSVRNISAGLGIIYGIILMETVIHLIEWDILIRNLAPPCEYDISSVRSSNFLPRRNSQIFSISKPLIIPYFSTGTIFHILLRTYGCDSLTRWRSEIFILITSSMSETNFLLSIIIRMILITWHIWWFYHIFYRKSKSQIIFSILQNRTILYSIFMKLIIWLGNPGKQYRNTRHNIGFIILDTLFENFREEKKFKSLVSNNFLVQTTFSWVVGIKPDTFMNLSGDAVATLVWFYKIDPKTDILVVR